MCRSKCAWWMVLEWNAFVVCSIGFDLYSSQHQEGPCLHTHEVSGSAMSIFFQSHPYIYGVVSHSMILNCKLSPRTKNLICIAVSSVTKTNSCLPPPVHECPDCRDCPYMISLISEAFLPVLVFIASEQQ